MALDLSRKTVQLSGGTPRSQAVGETLMIRVRQLAGVCFALLIFVAPAQGAMFETAAALTASETYAGDPRFQSVGYLAGQVPAGGYEFAGSAVLISPEWVLTAGHVITRSDNSGYSDMMFSIDADILGGDPPVYYGADAWFAYPGFQGTAPLGTNHDIGLVHLATPVTEVEPAVLFTGVDQRETLVHMAGYGYPGTASTGVGDFDGLKRAGDNVASGFGGDRPSWSSFESQYWLAPFLYQDSDLQPLEWLSTPGDSGAGWFAEIGGEMQLVGINHGVSGSYGMFSDSMAIRVSLYADWINETTGVPEPGTFSLLAVAGVVAVWWEGRRRRRKA